MNHVFAFCIALLFAPAMAFGQVELSFYGGGQSVPSSDVSIRNQPSGSEDFGADWDSPRFLGLRATQWRSPSFGIGIDFARNSVGASEDSLPSGYSELEFTDGVNTLTVNAYRRWSNVVGELTPYLGGGVGVALPRVEVIGDGTETDEIQLTGPAATLIAGASMPISDSWSFFGEYKGTISANTADLDGGGTLETDVLTNALNVGVSFNF